MRTLPGAQGENFIYIRRAMGDAENTLFYNQGPISICESDLAQ